jgi:hypothetical protein
VGCGDTGRTGADTGGSTAGLRTGAAASSETAGSGRMCGAGSGVGSGSVAAAAGTRHSMPPTSAAITSEEQVLPRVSAGTWCAAVAT